MEGSEHLHELLPFPQAILFSLKYLLPKSLKKLYTTTHIHE
jgi:hypothetical protein